MKIIAVDPRDVDAWIGGARAQIDLGFQDNARSWIARLEQAMPEHPAVADLLGRLRAGETLAEA
jgi:hypothetical protein